jgi:hypothetical protein
MSRVMVNSVAFLIGFAENTATLIPIICVRPLIAWYAAAPAPTPLPRLAA